MKTLFKFSKKSFNKSILSTFDPSQARTMDEMLILVDDKDNRVSSITKLEGKLI